MTKATEIWNTTLDVNDRRTGAAGARDNKSSNRIRGKKKDTRATPGERDVSSERRFTHCLLNIRITYLFHQTLPCVVHWRI